MSKDLLLALRSNPEPVSVPGLAAPLYVRVMSGVELFSWYTVGRDRADSPGVIAAALVARTVCEADGVRLFTDSDEDLAAVCALAGPVFNALYDAASRINVLNAKGREDAAKNS